MRRAFILLLWAALLAQTLWILAGNHPGGSSPSSMAFPVIVVAAFAALAVSGARRRWVPSILRLFVAYEFLTSVADRCGLYGGPGTHGVSWGDFGHFVISTRQINSFLPASSAFPLAVTATVAETVLGLALLIGFRIRLASRLSAVLLLLFATAMTISLPAAYQFMYGVFVLAAGSAVISTEDASLLSVDSIIKIRRANSKSG